MGNRTNAWWWHRWISKPTVTKEIQASADYSRLNALIDNKNANGDMDALADAILCMHDFCESIAIRNYQRRREIFIIFLYIASAVCSLGYLAVQLTGTFPILQGVAAASAVGLFAAAYWTACRTPAVIQNIESTSSVRKAGTFNSYFKQLGYEIQILDE
ncbi:MAG: hypothetical protein WCI45_05745 [Desulfuromonadales bacterium]